MAETKVMNIGIEIKNYPQKECNDENCPFHGHLKVHGKVRVVNVVSIKSRKTAKVEWEEEIYVKKYERVYVSKRGLLVHLPECLDIKEGDTIKIAETRPLSKMKHFVAVEKL